MIESQAFIDLKNLEVLYGSVYGMTHSRLLPSTLDRNPPMEHNYDAFQGISHASVYVSVLINIPHLIALYLHDCNILDSSTACE